MKKKQIYLKLVNTLLIAASIIATSCSSNEDNNEFENGTLKLNPSVSLDVTEAGQTKAITLLGYNTDDFEVRLRRTTADYNSSHRLGDVTDNGISLPAASDYAVEVSSNYLGVDDGNGGIRWGGANWDTYYYIGAYSPFTISEGQTTNLEFSVIQNTILIDLDFTSIKTNMPAGYDKIEAKVEAGNDANRYLVYTSEETRTGHFIAPLTFVDATTATDYGKVNYKITIKFTDTNNVNPEKTQEFWTEEFTANHKYKLSIKSSAKAGLNITVIDQPIGDPIFFDFYIN
ncbi:hypothetical protein DWB61_02620 [Ancylomarina euxinus]|uniref:DUF4493 domain-containing protein n=1 Tax=Ancylomarina euxinus TaxID=2283627 RepID=A0A425Y6E6_9BACT|nr:hypothetical protein [Ancylomarina euxinus]MCZ4694104.1 hypothetical protein [Ancylomarina euxinus]MUP15769.1 hypothetical protein [Ancylomarina euxinus]RRG24026.1 hypothetical protein DWB61_02620 [Ancylomarina euxinus]